MYKLPGRWLKGAGWGESHGCGDKLRSLVGTLRLLRQLQASLQERHGEVWLQKNSVFLESCFRLVPKRRLAALRTMEQANWRDLTRSDSEAAEE